MAGYLPAAQEYLFPVMEIPETTPVSLARQQLADGLGTALAQIASLPFDKKIHVSDLCRNQKPALSPVTNFENVKIEENKRVFVVNF